MDAAPLESEPIPSCGRLHSGRAPNEAAISDLLPAQIIRGWVGLNLNGRDFASALRCTFDVKVTQGTKCEHTQMNARVEQRAASLLLFFLFPTPDLFLRIRPPLLATHGPAILSQPLPVPLQFLSRTATIYASAAKLPLESPVKKKQTNCFLRSWTDVLEL